MREKHNNHNKNHNTDLSTERFDVLLNSVRTGQRLDKLVIAFLSSFDIFQLRKEIRRQRSQCADDVHDQYLSHCHIPHCDFIFRSFILLGYAPDEICTIEFHVNTIVCIVSGDSECVNKFDTWVSCVPTFSWAVVHLKFKVVIKIAASNENIDCASGRQHLSRSNGKQQRCSPRGDLHLTKANTHIRDISHSKCLIWKSYRNDRYDAKIVGNSFWVS